MTENEFEARMLLAGWEQYQVIPSYWKHPDLHNERSKLPNGYQFFPRDDAEKAWDEACAALESVRRAHPDDRS